MMVVVCFDRCIRITVRWSLLSNLMSTARLSVGKRLFPACRHVLWVAGVYTWYNLFTRHWWPDLCISGCHLCVYMCSFFYGFWVSESLSLLFCSLHVCLLRSSINVNQSVNQVPY